MGTTTRGNLPAAYSVKTVAGVLYEPFSGLTSDFKKWYDSVINAYGAGTKKCGYTTTVYQVRFNFVQYQVQLTPLFK